MATATVQISHPESLEKIFQKLEQESERRAQALHLASNPASVAAARRANRDRRRTSVSISRFGQVEDTQTTTFNIPTTPTSPIFYAQRQPHSTDSLQSNSSTEDVHDFQRESDHVTQVERIPSKQSIGRSVGGILQRTLSRSRSKPQLVAGADLDVVIGVVVEEAATVEHAAEDDEVHSRPLSRAMVYSDAPRTLRNQTSRQTIGDAAGSREKKGLVCRAKQFFRARSQTVSSLSRA